MKRVIPVIALLLIGQGLCAAPAAAQEQIDVNYVAPGNAELKPVYDRLKQRKMLEQLQLFLSPLKLPTRLLIKTQECGNAFTVPYQPGGPVTICYEYIARIERSAPAEANILLGPGLSTRENQGYLRRDDLLVGPVVMLALHEVALAVFDLLELPVWGALDESADRVAGFIMTQFGKDVAWKTLMGASWYLGQTTIVGGADFAYVRNSEAHRFYNYLCMAYGSDRQAFGFLARNLDIPSNRADWCGFDYQQVRYAFEQTILPHVDEALLKKVQAIKWLAPAAK